MLEDRKFFKGINLDDHDRDVPQGDYVDSYNIRIYDTETGARGKVKNIKGTTLVSFALPDLATDNVCIGTRSDTNTGNVFYFIFNRHGHHGIYLFTPQNNTIQTVFQDPILGFQEFQRINHANLVAGKLLYWTDGGIPKKLNIEKALENKERIYNIYFGDFSDQSAIYSISVIEPSGAVHNLTPVAIPAQVGRDAFALSKFLETAFPNPYFTLKAQGAFLTATMNNIGKYQLIINCTCTNQVIAVAHNFYPTPYSFDLIDRLKYPPHFEPKAQYKIDSLKETNYVQNRVFQFAVQYVYDDDEPSTISPISVLPDFGSQCTQSLQQSLYNYIEVDFTEDRINDVVSRSLFQYINLYFREQNTGKFQLIKTLQPWEWGIGTNILKFYNDGIYQVLDDATAAKLFSDVPIESGAQEFIGNKLVDGNYKEGYDNVVIDAELNTTYQSPPSEGFTLRGLVEVLAFSKFVTGRTGPGGGTIQVHNTDLGAPLYTYNGDTVFGGFDTNVNGGIVSNLPTRYFQSIPLGGFVFYLAGTDLLGISKQNATGLSMQTTDGLLQINDNNFGTASAYEKSTGFTSTWIITGVQPGIYTLRVASHLTTATDISNGTRGYQKTSTTIADFRHLEGFPQSPAGVAGTGQTEIIIEVLNNGDVNLRDANTYAFIKNIPNGQLIDTTYIRDLSVWGAWRGIGIMGYLVDSEGENITSQSDALGLQRVTRTKTQINIKGNNGDNIFPASNTDHNGFFYGVFPSYFNYYPYSVGLVDLLNYVHKHDVLNGIEQHYYNNFGTTFTYGTSVVTINQDEHAEFGIYLYNDNTLTDYGRTFIEGKVVDVNGLPASNINIAIPYHGTATTYQGGNYSISFYSYIGGNNLIILASSIGGLCTYLLIPSYQQFNNIPIGNSGTDFNDDSFNLRHFNHANYPLFIDFIATLINVIRTDALKRGGDWDFGIVYYDRGLRSGTVNTNEKTHLHILFYTEKDSNGVLPITGEPLVDWKIKHLPPAWATHWQWVRTSNLALSYYLQFIANRIHYVNLPTAYDSSTNPDVTYSNANYISIDLTNLQSYKNRNASSLLAYTWTKGDRIRFIKDSPGNFFNQYYDYEIVYQDTSGTTPCILILNDLSFPQQLAGVEFEIYTPRLNVANKIYYEIGETFKIINGFHEGLSQNQTSSQPATGTFRTGDAWYRKRQLTYNTGTPTNPVPVPKIIFIDDQSVSDFYLSKDDNIGRINILDLNAQQLVREKSMLPSGIYIQNTRVNLLSWNDSTDAKEIEKGDGAITKLQVAGRVLLAYQPSRINSVYINEIQYVDSSGNKTLTASDSFLGTVNPLELLTGTVNPESVQEIEGKVWHYDRMNGMFVRYSGNGLFPISNYKVISFAWGKAEELKKVNNDGIYVLGFINPSQKEYGASFVDLKNSTPLIKQETIAFVDNEDRWTSRYDHIPEAYAYSNGKLIGFKNGQLWLHDMDATKCNNFYGVQYSSKLTFVSNENNTKMRIFIGVAVDGSELWYCPDISIPASIAYPNGMASRLRSNAFRRVGTDWYAAFKKDLNTPNKVSADEALINGRSLQGHVIQITLQNDSLTEVDLDSCCVRYLLSEFTKK